MILTLKFNSRKVLTSGKSKHLEDLLASKNINTKKVYLSKAYKTVWNSKEKFNITKHMKDELYLLVSVSKSLISFHWETPIRHVIPYD